MKTILAAIFVALFASVAHADEKIVIINANKVGGILHKMAEHVSTSMSETFADPINVANCSAAVNILKNTSKPTIAFWDPINHAVSKDQTCDIIDENNFVTIYAQTYYQFCALNGKAENNLESLIEGKKKIGVADHSTTKKQLKETLKGLDSNAVMIPYPSSAEVLAALTIGEIDYVYTGRITQDMNCVLTNDPNSTTVPTVSSYFNNPFAYSGYKVAVIGVNIDIEYVRDQLYMTYENENWMLTFIGFNYDLANMDRLDLYDLIEEEIATIQLAKE